MIVLNNHYSDDMASGNSVTSGFPSDITKHNVAFFNFNFDQIHLALITVRNLIPKISSDSSIMSISRSVDLAFVIINRVIKRPCVGFGVSFLPPFGLCPMVAWGGERHGHI